MSHGADSVKSIIFALCANLAIAISKLIAAAVTGSSAMMAEFVHSLADSGNQLLLLLGIKHAVPLRRIIPWVLARPSISGRLLSL